MKHLPLIVFLVVIVLVIGASLIFVYNPGALLKPRFECTQDCEEGMEVKVLNKIKNDIDVKIVNNNPRECEMGCIFVQETFELGEIQTDVVEFEFEDEKEFSLDSSNLKYISCREIEEGNCGSDKEQVFSLR